MIVVNKIYNKFVKANFFAHNYTSYAPFQDYEINLISHSTFDEP